MFWQKDYFFTRLISVQFVFCSMIFSMDVGMHKDVQAVFAERNIMSQAILSCVDLRSLTRFALTCSQHYIYSFLNIASVLPLDSLCFDEGIKKVDFDRCKNLLQYCASENKVAVFGRVWNLREKELQEDLRKCSHLQTTVIRPEIAMKIYQTEYKRLASNYKKEEERAQKEKTENLKKQLKKQVKEQEMTYKAHKRGLRKALFHGTAKDIKRYLKVLGQVDAFDVIPRGSFFDDYFDDDQEYSPRGYDLSYTKAVFYVVCYHGDVNIASKLLSKCIAEKPNKAVHYLLNGGYLALFANMADLGKININSVDKQGKNCLHHAAQCNEKDTSEYLLECGASINCCDKKGRTPFHDACKYGALQVVEILLSYKDIDPHQKDLKEKEPQDLLDKKNQIVKLLIKQHDQEKKKKD